MPIAPSNEKRLITNVIKHFKFDELETSVLPLFSETSWKDVKKCMIEKHQNFSVLNVTRIIEQLIDEHNLSEKDLKTRLALLEVIDISKHYKKKIWYTFELKGTKSTKFMTKREIERRLVESFNQYQVKIEVQTTSNDGIIFVGIKTISTKKTVRPPTFFFALVLGQKYFFCSKKTVTSIHTKAISNTMGYKDCKTVQLFGRNLPSLIKLIWQKKQGAVNTNTIDVPYQEAKPIINSTGIDFTQGIHRKKYVETFFGTEPPQVETLTLRCPESLWTDEETFEKLADEKLFIGWSLGSLNINNFLQNLAKEKVLKLPMPPYLTHWTTSGKNCLTLKQE